MDRREEGPFPPAPVGTRFAFAALTALVYVAGFATVAAWFALVVLGPPVPAPAARSHANCGVCGVVEGVAEFERPSLQLSGDKGEGLVVLLAALGGSRAGAAAPGRVYETVVLHDDGTVRIVRDDSAAYWKRGDRVRVIKGRIETAALAALPAERTPNPIPPVARAP